MNLLRMLVRLSLIWTLAVIALGAYTRLVDAGLGCPDWPGCYGHWTWPQEETDIAAAQEKYPDAPYQQDKAWPEMVHRYLAGILGILVFSIAISIHIRSFLSPQYRLPVRLGWVAVAVVMMQGLLGMWTVTLRLWPQVVMAHLAGGFTLLVLLFFIELKLRKSSSAPTMTSLAEWQPRFMLKTLGGLGLLFLCLQILLGGWMSANYAALACVDFPLCQGQWWPTMHFAEGFNFFQVIGPNYLYGMLDHPARTAIHFTHRLNAILVSLLLLILVWRCHATRIAQITRHTHLVLALLFIQTSLGIANVLFHVPLTIAVMHNVAAALLLVAVCNLLWRIQCLRPSCSTPTMF